jgi:hypothetical protein
MTDELARAVEEQVAAILAQRGGVPFRAEQADMLDSLDAQVNSMLQDRSLGRILNGPLWLSGASVVDGTVTATKLIVNTLESVTANTGSLNVTGNFTAAASFPAAAARIVINSSGLYGYQSDGVTTTFKLNVNGSGEIGSGSNKITWTNTGAIAIPAALITSLTIANISGGIFGGTYTTSAGTAKISLSTSGITVTDSGGNTTFNLVASTGAVTATGSFTIQSASSGTRVVLSSAGGIEGYNGTTQTFLLNAATGAGQLGPTAGGNYISWSSTGVTIGGVAMSGGKITASALSVTTLSALSADAGTITAGTITAATITTGTLSAARISGGTLGGSFTVPAGQPVTLDSGGTAGDVLVLKSGGATKGSIYASSSRILTAYTSGGSVELYSTGVQIVAPSGYWFQLDAAGNNLSGPLLLPSITTGGNTPAAFPTGGTGTSVIMSTDDGSTLLSIDVAYVVHKINGTNRKLLYVA